MKSKRAKSNRTMPTLVGEKHKMLLVVGENCRRNGQIFWDCICDCGNKKTLSTAKLRGQYPISCGCHRKSFKKETCLGLTRSPSYPCYAAMKTRVLNKNHINYDCYGGRGIKICDRWLGKDGAKNFIFDMGDRPSNKHSLDRIDNNGDYTPENCRWATMSEQNANRRNSVKVEINGVNKSIKEWADEAGVNYSTMQHRIKSGIAEGRILEKKLRANRIILYADYNGVRTPLKDISRETGVPYGTLYSRFKNNLENSQSALTL